MNKEWGTPISKEKIIDRRNKLIEYQKIGEVRFTPLYEVIDENILDINYMIYEIERLNNRIDKAIERIKQIQLNAIKYGAEHDAVICQDLLNILQGSEDND